MRRSLGFALLLGLFLAPAGCSPPESDRLQGYIEGEYVFIGAARAGRLAALEVARGDQVAAGDPLFALDRSPEAAARDEAERRLAEGRATWEDLRKGRRPSEIDSLEAQLALARTELALSEQDLARLEVLSRSDAASVRELDDARSERDQGLQSVARLEADLRTARLGSREDQIAAAEAHVRALEAALERAEWDLSQQNLSAPEAAMVFDTFYRPGEWVEAGKPVVALLPPRNIHVRAFVPERRLGELRIGQSVRVLVDGAPAPYAGTVRFISPSAEYTPPVIYSRESRAKLVFRFEVAFPPEVAAELHPGQPVDVEIVPAP